MYNLFLLTLITVWLHLSTLIAIWHDILFCSLFGDILMGARIENIKITEKSETILININVNVSLRQKA